MDANSYPTIVSVRSLHQEDPHTTKSRGTLNVLFQMNFQDTLRFMNHDHNELLNVGSHIRGLRSYTVSDLPAGTIGGTEFHRLRQEIIFTLRGKVVWGLEDVYGSTDQFNCGVGEGFWMQPFTMHTYQVMEAGSQLLVIANTLFPLENRNAWDTYSMEEFRTLQQEVRQQQ